MRDRLREAFPQMFSAKLLSEEEYRAMFAGCLGEEKCGWDTFYEKHPQASGITTFSRVGFNGTHDAALLRKEETLHPPLRLAWSRAGAEEPRQHPQ